MHWFIGGHCIVQSYLRMLEVETWVIIHLLRNNEMNGLISANER